MLAFTLVKGKWYITREKTSGTANLGVQKFSKIFINKSISLPRVAQESLCKKKNHIFEKV